MDNMDNRAYWIVVSIVSLVIALGVLIGFLSIVHLIA